MPRDQITDVDPRRILPYFSTDPQAEEETSAIGDIFAGMLPGIGQAQAARDFSRAKKSGSKLGMGLASLAAVPLVGKPARVGVEATIDALRAAPKLLKAADDTRPVAQRWMGKGKPLGEAVRIGRTPEAQAALDQATKQELQAAALRREQGGAPFPHLATRYPTPGEPTFEFRTVKKGKPVVEEGAYLKKGPSGESAAFMQERQRIVDEMNTQGFPRYFDPEQRTLADVSHYPTTETTQAAARPKKADTVAKHLAAIQTPEAESRLDEAYKLGKEVGGGDRWYYMGQMQKKYMDELGPVEGAKRFKEDFADQMAATTGGADPTDNFLMTGYANFQKGKGLPASERAYEIPSPVGGRYIGGNMEMANKVMGGQPLTAAGQPKRFNFSRNFQGDMGPSTMDERMTQLVTGENAPRNNTYFAHEQLLTEPGPHRVDPHVRGAERQDVTWLGKKLMDDLEEGVPREKLEPGVPMIEHVNRAIHRTSKLTGLSPDEVVRGWIKRTTPVFGVAGGAALIEALRNREEPTA
jgi:hypothetical protein